MMRKMSVPEKGASSVSCLSENLKRREVVFVVCDVISE